MRLSIISSLLFPMLLPAAACPVEPGERKKDEKSVKDLLEEEKVLDEEQEFPDLVRVDETGELMDEFAFLEESLSSEEVVSASKHRQHILCAIAQHTAGRLSRMGIGMPICQDH